MYVHHSSDYNCVRWVQSPQEDPPRVCPQANTTICLHKIKLLQHYCMYTDICIHIHTFILLQLA